MKLTLDALHKLHRCEVKLFISRIRFDEFAIQNKNLVKFMNINVHAIHKRNKKVKKF